MSSSIELGTDEFEAVELPPVRPPSVRPGHVRPGHTGGYRSSFASLDDEMTIVRLDKRVSTSPPPRASAPMPRIPRNPVPRFDDEPMFPRRRYADDEPTMLHPSSTSQRPLLSMTTPSHRTILVEEELPRSRPHLDVPPPPPPSSRAVVSDAPPRSSVAVDAAASSSLMPAAIDLSMTSSLSGSTDIRRMRGSSFARAALLVAVGVFGGLIAAVAARGDGLSAVASLVDPTHVSADVANAHVGDAQPVQAQPQVQAQAQQAPASLRPGAAAPQIVTKPAAPSCNADPVAPKAEPKAEPKVVERKVVVEAVAAPPEPKVVVAKPAPVVHHAAPVVRHVAAPAPVAHVSHVSHVTHHAARHHDEVDSANAADALAKAQLEAALTR